MIILRETFIHLNFIASLTYDYRKSLSHRKIIVRFSCNQAPGVEVLAAVFVQLCRL